MSSPALVQRVRHLWKEFKKRYSNLKREHHYRQTMKRLPPSLNTSERPLPVVVTLSTTPRRLFHKTDIAITTLLCQTLRPDRVILWLSDALKSKSLPKSFTHLMRAGLDVQYRPDLGPHTKLVYALQENPDCLLVSADDDVLYPSTWLADLYASYQLAPQYIHCHRAHLMQKDGEGKLIPYQQWGHMSPGFVGPSHLLFPTGVGGVLYPPNSLAQEVFNVETFRRLCPHADDIWFKAMALLQGTASQKVNPYWRSIPLIEGSQVEKLSARNIVENDWQIQATFDTYDLHRLL